MLWRLSRGNEDVVQWRGVERGRKEGKAPEERGGGEKRREDEEGGGAKSTEVRWEEGGEDELEAKLGFPRGGLARDLR
jgi:hypothetical protein